LAGLLVASSLCVTGAEARVAQTMPTPDAVTPQTPIPIPILLQFSTQLAKMPAPAPQPVACPRHTKPRVDCTPVLQR
jgi:hypothetical protein